jgi:hypothetical protein
LAFLGLTSLSIGFFYIHFYIDKFKKIYGAIILSSILLLPLLIPLEVGNEEDQRGALIAQIIFISASLFSFVYLGFIHKKKTLTP